MNILCQTLGPHQHDEQNDIVEASSITDTCHLPLTHHYPAGRSSYHVCSLISHSHTIILPVSLLTMYVHSSPTPSFITSYAFKLNITTMVLVSSNHQIRKSRLMKVSMLCGSWITSITCKT